MSAVIYDLRLIRVQRALAAIQRLDRIRETEGRQPPFRPTREADPLDGWVHPEVEEGTVMDDLIARLRLMSMSKRTLYGEGDLDAPFFDEAADEIARLRAALATAEAERDAAVERAGAMHRRAQEAEGARVKSAEAMAIMLEKHAKPSLNVTHWYRKWKAAVERAERAEAALRDIGGVGYAHPKDAKL